MAKLGFKDFLNVDYAPGMPDEVKRNAKKRKMDTPTGNTGESVEQPTEALTPTQRRARARMFKKYKQRIKIGQERAKRRIASPEKLKKRARKQARMVVLNKLVKDVKKGDMTYAKRQELEKRLDSPTYKKQIDRIAKKMLPKVRKDELAKKRG